MSIDENNELDDDIILEEKNLEDLIENTKKYPNKSESWSELAEFYFYELNDYEKAIENFNKSIELDSNNIYNYTKLINIYKAIEDYDNILKTIKQLIDIDPNNEYNHLMLFEYYDSRNDYDNAIKAINKVIEVSPEEYNYLKLAAYYDKIGRIDEAIETINKIIELGIAVNDGVNYFMLGKYYMKKGDNNSAQINFNKAM